MKKEMIELGKYGFDCEGDFISVEILYNAEIYAGISTYHICPVCGDGASTDVAYWEYKK